MLCTSLVSWHSKKQTVTSRSTVEADYRALADTTCEIVWLQSLLLDLHVTFDRPTLVYCDNQSAIYIYANPVHHARTKHIEMDSHFVREEILVGLISPIKIASKDQLTDLLTKSLERMQYWSMLQKLGAYNLCLVYSTETTVKENDSNALDLSRNLIEGIKLTNTNAVASTDAARNFQTSFTSGNIMDNNICYNVNNADHARGADNMLGIRACNAGIITVDKGWSMKSKDKAALLMLSIPNQ